MQGVFGPLGFLLIWDAWTCLLDFSSAVQGSALGSSTPCLRRSGFRRSQRKVSVPHVQRGWIQPLSCECLQCVMCGVVWSAVRARADACLHGEPLSKCRGVLCTEEVTEGSSGSWTLAALCWKTLAYSGKAGMEQSWFRQASALHIPLLSEGNTWACPATPTLLLSCQHPMASGCPVGDRGGQDIPASAG